MQLNSRRRLLLVLLAVVAIAAPLLSSASAGARPAPTVAAHAKHATTAAAATTHSKKRKFVFVNRTSETIWVAGAQQSSTPKLHRSGWKLPVGARVSVTVPNKWNGRFWGRTGCSFRHGRGPCKTGDCDHRLQCQGFGSIPATLGEWDLDAWDHLDFYDVSMVDGSNLPMWINLTHGKTTDPINKWGCETAGCTRAVRCPQKLVVAGPACESPCAKLGGDRYCCRGQYAAGCNPATTWPVDYARVFKRAEPYAYSWSGDDQTSVFTCSGRCNYRITFGLTPKVHRQKAAQAKVATTSTATSTS